MHCALVFEDKMWVLGGQVGKYCSARNDVWTSTDAITWTQVTSAAAWSPRSDHNAVVFQNKMWVLGGGKNDVWYSSDGKNWTCATSKAAWPARSMSQTVVYRNKLWIVGGGTDLKDYNDLWYSEDGAAWTQATPAATWAPRWNHRAVVYKDKLWVLGGKDGGYKHHNDIWYYELPATGVQGSEKPKTVVTGMTVDAIRSAASGGPVAIRYTLSKPGDVSIGIYTCAGREIRTLLNGIQSAGAHALAWDGYDERGAKVGAGAHFIRFQTGGGVIIRKIVVIGG